MMWNRQSPAWVMLRLVKLLSAGTAAAGVVLGILLLVSGENGAVTAAVSYTITAIGLTAAVFVLWRRNIWRTGENLYRRSGLIARTEYSLPAERLTAMVVERSLFLSIFRAVRIVSFSSADSARNARRSALFVNRETGRKLVQRLMPMDKGYVRRYSANHREVFLMAVSGADFFSGLLLTVPLIAWPVKNIDRRLSERLYSALEQTGRLILPETSPWVSALAVIPAAGWLLHVLYIIFAYGKFRYVRSGGSVMIGRGVIGRRSICFPISSVTALERRRTLLSGMSRMEECRAVIPGYGRCILIPAAQKREMMIETAAIFPHGEVSMSVVTGNVFLWWRWWAISGMAVLAAALKLAADAGAMHDVVLLIAVPSAIMLFWRAWMGAAAGKAAGVKFFSDSVEITGIRGLSVCCLRVLRGNIAEARITQNFFQQSNGLCSLYIRPKGAQRGLWCRHLPFDRCISLIGRLG